MFMVGCLLFVCCRLLFVDVCRFACLFAVFSSLFVHRPLYFVVCCCSFMFGVVWCVLLLVVCCLLCVV